MIHCDDRFTPTVTTGQLRRARHHRNRENDWRGRLTTVLNAFEPRECGVQTARLCRALDFHAGNLPLVARQPAAYVEKGVLVSMKGIIFVGGAVPAYTRSCERSPSNCCRSTTSR